MKMQLKIILFDQETMNIGLLAGKDVVLDGN